MSESIIPVGLIVGTVGPTGVAVTTSSVMDGIMAASLELLASVPLGAASPGCYADAIGRTDRTMTLTAQAPDPRPSSQQQPAVHDPPP